MQYHANMGSMILVSCQNLFYGLESPKYVDCCHAFCRCSASQETPCLMTSLSWPWLGKGQGLDPPRMSSSSQQVKFNLLDSHIWVWATPNRTFHDQKGIYDPVSLKQIVAGMHSSVTVFLAVIIRTVMTCLQGHVRPNSNLIHQKLVDADSDILPL